MYKTRISKWGLEKYFKKEDLGAVAKTLEPFARAGLRIPSAVVNKREVPTNRVKRHFKDSFRPNDRILPAEALQLELTSNDPRKGLHTRDSENSKAQRRPQKVLKIILQHSDELHLFEATLVQVSNYFSWRVAQPEDYFLLQGHYGGQGCSAATLLIPYVFSSELVRIMDGLKSDVPHEVRERIERLLALVPQMLLQQHPALISVLVNSFAISHEYWTKQSYCKIWACLLKLANKLLKHRDHPILMIIKLFLNFEGQISLPVSVMSLLCDVARRQFELVHPEFLFAIEIDMAYLSSRYSEYDVALEGLQSLLRRYKLRYDEAHPYCRRILQMLGALYCKEGLCAEGKQFLLRAIELDEKFARNPHDTDYTTTTTLSWLAFCCECMNELVEAKKWYTEAYTARCSLWGPQDDHTLMAFHRLNGIRRLLGEEVTMAEPREHGDIDSLEALENEFEAMALAALPPVDTCGTSSAPWNEWDGDGERHVAIEVSSSESDLMDDSPSIGNESREDRQEPQIFDLDSQALEDLPDLEDNPEFDYCSYMEATFNSADFDIGLREPVFQCDTDVSSPKGGFFDCGNITQWHALEGTELSNDLAFEEMEFM